MSGSRGLKAHQGNGLGQPDDDCPRNLVMPALLLPIPADPEKAQEENESRKHCRDAAHDGSQKTDRQPVFAHNLQIEHDSANGCSLPGPHTREVSHCHEDGERPNNRRRQTNQDNVQETRAHAFPEARPWIGQRARRADRRTGIRGGQKRHGVRWPGWRGRWTCCGRSRGRWIDGPRCRRRGRGWRLRKASRLAPAEQIPAAGRRTEPKAPAAAWLVFHGARPQIPRSRPLQIPRGSLPARPATQ